MPKPPAFNRRNLLRAAVYGTLVGGPAIYALWPRGLDVRDGRHDRGENGIWLQHGWLGDDTWFVLNHKEDRRAFFRDRAPVEELRARLDKHNIRDLFPHLCPALPGGALMPVDADATRAFLDVFDGMRVMPWIGGVLGASVFLDDEQWQAAFVSSTARLLADHPRLAGVHLNVEPCPDGHPGFLLLLEALRAAAPGKLLSVAAFPPPSILHPHSDVHWGERFYRDIAARCDQIVPMLYNTGLFLRQPYRALVRDWAREVLAWCGPTEVLLGLPAYGDNGVGYHDPDVENLDDSLLGVHEALSQFEVLPEHYRGIATYSEWTMTDEAWQSLRACFVRNG
ncbi:MAG: hypothetical protein HOW73_33985 [Polyangiaceae bacterium]|nr:hypothetical protein [Polyangiaceae bacterium]